MSVWAKLCNFITGRRHRRPQVPDPVVLDVVAPDLVDFLCELGSEAVTEIVAHLPSGVRLVDARAEAHVDWSIATVPFFLDVMSLAASRANVRQAAMTIAARACERGITQVAPLEMPEIPGVALYQAVSRARNRACSVRLVHGWDCQRGAYLSRLEMMYR